MHHLVKKKKHPQTDSKATQAPPPVQLTTDETSRPAPAAVASNARASSATKSFMSWEKQKSIALLTSVPPQRRSAAAAQASSMPMPTRVPTDAALSGTTIRLATPPAVEGAVVVGGEVEMGTRRQTKTCIIGQAASTGRTYVIKFSHEPNPHGWEFNTSVLGIR